MPRFDFIVFHERFTDHQAEGGRRIVTEREVEDVWHGARSLVRNVRREGSYLLRGTTMGGRSVTVVLLATSDPETWLAYTAWESSN